MTGLLTLEPRDEVGVLRALGRWAGAGSRQPLGLGARAIARLSLQDRPSHPRSPEVGESGLAPELSVTLCGRESQDLGNMGGGPASFQHRQEASVLPAAGHQTQVGEDSVMAACPGPQSVSRMNGGGWGDSGLDQRSGWT